MLSGSELNNELVRRYKCWLSALDYSPYVRNAYPHIVRRFCDSVGTKSVLQTTPWDVRKFVIRESRRALSYPAIRQRFGVLQNFAQFLDLGGLRGRIPLESVRMRAVGPRNPPHVVSPSTILKLVAAAQTKRDTVIVELLYATGCRPKELVNARVRDIDFESRKMRVRGKNDKSRYVVFGDKAAQAIKAYLRGRTTGYLLQPTFEYKGVVYASSRYHKWIGEVDVITEDRPHGRRKTFFLGSTNAITLDNARAEFEKRKRALRVVEPTLGPMHTNTVRRTLDSLALRAGIRSVAPRTIRHCFATHLLDGGADIREIQLLLGHDDLTSTQIYTHVSRKRLSETFDRCHPRGNHAEDCQ